MSDIEVLTSYACCPIIWSPFHEFLMALVDASSG